MKYLLAMTLFMGALYADLEQTQGPEGGNLMAFTTLNSDIYGISSRGSVFYHDAQGWGRLPAVDGSHQIFTFDDKLFTIGYEGVHLLTAGATSWELVLSGNQNNYSISDDRIYVMSSDSVSHSLDGVNWFTTFDSLHSRVELFGDTLTQQLFSPEAIIKTGDNYLMACMGNISMTQSGIYISPDSGLTWFEPEGLPPFNRTLEMIEVDAGVLMSTSSGVYFSDDDGWTWQPRNHGFNQTNPYLFSLLEQNGRVFGVVNGDQHIYELVDTSWVSILDTDYCRYISSGPENSLLVSDYYEIKQLNLDNLEVTDLTTGLIASNHRVLALGIDEALAYTGNRSSYFTQDGGMSWEVFPHNVYKVINLGGDILFYGDSGLMFTSDWGVTVEPRQGGIPTDNRESIAALCQDGETLYIGLSRTRARTHLSPVWEAGGIYRSTNGGQTWTSVSNGLPMEGGIRAPIYDLTAHEGMLVTTTIAGTYRSLDGGISWSSFEGGFQQYESPSQMIGHDGSIYAATYFGIKRSTTHSDSWDNLSEGLTNYSSGYAMRFAEVNGDLYAYDNGIQVLYTLVDSIWVPQESPTPYPVSFNNLSTVDGHVYASIIDGGVWSGSLTTTITKLNNVNIPDEYIMLQNYPNPFNPTTTIRYDIPEQSKVLLTVFDIQGKEVIKLQENVKHAGSYAVQWSGLDNFDIPISTGVYFCRLQAGTQTKTIKMLYLE